VTHTPPIQELIAKVVARIDLTEAEAQAGLETIMAGEATDAQIAGLLTALRMKGETVDEVAGAVRAMRARVTPVALPEGVVLDTCGTGGDGAGTFNISTTAAFVCAAGGVVVAKHGNRAFSSRVGSADVLERLGVRIDLSAAQVARCVEEVGVGFMFAPSHHAALRHAGPARRELGFRTLLNLIGPMTNPARATHQLIGIYDPARLVTVAEVLRRLGTRRAMVVHGEVDGGAGGLDEVSVSGPTHAVVLDRGAITEQTLTPEELGVPRAPVASLRGGDGAENARIVRAVLAHEDRGPRADAVRLNAGCALWVAEAASSVAEGVALATELLASGRALAKLEALARWSREVAG